MCMRHLSEYHACSRSPSALEAGTPVAAPGASQAPPGPVQQPRVPASLAAGDATLGRSRALRPARAHLPLCPAGTDPAPVSRVVPAAVERSECVEIQVDLPCRGRSAVLVIRSPCPRPARLKTPRAPPSGSPGAGGKPGRRAAGSAPPTRRCSERSRQALPALRRKPRWNVGGESSRHRLQAQRAGSEWAFPVASGTPPHRGPAGHLLTLAMGQALLQGSPAGFHPLHAPGSSFSCGSELDPFLGQGPRITDT